MRWRTPALAAVLVCSSILGFAGGPAFVAGSGFDADVEGQALVWANGNVQYFTDQGDLSPILSNSQADAFVSNAFASWTAISGVGLTATQGGHLAEDVNGTNVIGYPDGTYSIPADVQPTALTTPVGIVYDYDGKVTDALLGAGAGGADYCFTNAVYGGPDNFSSDGHLVHALVVINGVCVASTPQLPDVRYRLMRTLGRVLGLDWSQANPNVITRNPAPTADDFEGFPLMHYSDPISCVPISICYPDADVPKIDDRAALRRLYPAGGDHPGKMRNFDAQAQTARIHGSVYFTDANGNPTQPMQGVNVVARWIDASEQPSRQYVATSVSGFAFRGNAGNPVNGFVDTQGRRYDYFGSDDPALEGAFDLAGLEFPDGSDSAQYQLTVEPIDAYWAVGVGPYAPFQVAPSGQFAQVVVTVQRGSDAPQDILMQQSAVAHADLASGGTYANPSDLPQSGGWGAWISGYGDADWFHFSAHANRTASVAATAQDETGQPTEAKLMPVIGIWPLSDQSGDPAPAATPSAFNTLVPGMSRLDAQFSADGDFRLGIADFRGDGRPDYFYVASVLYSDTITPARLSLAGGAVALDGIGFHPGLQVSADGASATVLSASAKEMLVALPAGLQDGTASIVVTDPATGSFSQMIGALTYGAAATDQLLLLQGSEPATPVGAQAANAIRVRVVAADGLTPVDGATVAWTATNGAVLSVCSGASSCSVHSDEAGLSPTWLTPMATGTSTVTATLAPASYSSPAYKQTTVVGTESALDLGALAPTKWIGQGATLDVPLTVRVLSQGTPQPQVSVNFQVVKGTSGLSANNANTDTNGYATISAHLTNHSNDVQVSACVAPNNSPCQTFTLFATPASLWTLESVAGASQVVPEGQAFQSVIMRVTDGSGASNPVMGVSVTFNTVLERLPAGSGSRQEGDSIVGGTGMPVLLGMFQTQVVTTENGLASIVPNTGNVSGGCDVFITISAGSSTKQLHLQILGPMGGGQAETQRATTRPRRSRGFQSQPSTQATPVVLFAVPQGVPSLEPSADLCPNTAPDSSPDPAAGDNFDVAQPGRSGVEESAPHSRKGADAGAGTPDSPRLQEPVDQSDTNVRGHSGESPPESAATTRQFLRDKGICRSVPAGYE